MSNSERSVAAASSGARSGSMGAMGGVLFGLVFAGFGAVFLGFMIVVFAAEVKPLFWEKVPCRVGECEIQIEPSRDMPFRMKVDYEYVREGTTHRSERYALSEQWKSDYEELALDRAELLAGGDGIICRVDPEDPNSAVLRVGELWFIVFAIVPVIFVIAGILVVISSISVMRNAKRGEVAARSGPLSTGRKGGGCFLIVFGVVFFLAGIAVFAGIFALPIKRYLQSSDWEQTECSILWSTVRSHSGDDGTTYSSDIFYEYEWNGENYRSNRYSPMGVWSSSGRARKQRLVDKYSKGTLHRCLVNPSVPQQAMLERAGAGLWFGLIPLLFVAVGAGIVFAGVRSRRKVRGESQTALSAHSQMRWGGRSLERVRNRGNGRHSDDWGTRRPDGSLELRPGKSRWIMVLAMLLFGLLWNGIVSVFVREVIDGWSRGRGEWMLTLFMIPFVLVGLGIIVLFFYSLLQLFNPQIVVSVFPEGIRLGSNLKLRWRAVGRTRRLRNLKIIIRAKEAATYRRGTRTTTDESTFFRRELFHSSQPLEMIDGAAEVMIPGDLMFSFDSGSNKIVWEIVIEGDIPSWPDVEDAYTIQMLPPG